MPNAFCILSGFLLFILQLFSNKSSIEHSFSHLEEFFLRKGAYSGQEMFLSSNSSNMSFSFIFICSV